MSLLRELEGIRQQILQHLLQPFRIGEHRLRQAWIETQQEIDALRFGDVAESPFDVASQIVKRQIGRVDDDRAGFDLGQIKNVVDQIEQVVA